MPGRAGSDRIGAATYSGRITGSIFLRSNPATIAADAYVTNAGGPVGVFGTTGTAWSVVNFGTVAAANAIYLEAGGSIANLGGVIRGATIGVAIGGAAGAVSNAGYISGGVVMTAGGVVLNEGGTITGALDGVAISGGSGSVTNSGVVIGTGTNSAGIYLSNGGYVSNTASVTGVGEGIAVGNAAGTVVNLGAVGATATTGIGVHLTGGGRLANDAGAQIAGSLLGVAIGGGSGTVINYSTIAADTPKGVGVYLTGGGYLNNISTGLIDAGGQGVIISGGNATVVDYGTIIGGYGLIVDPGAGGYATVTVGGTIIGTRTVVSAGRTFQEAIQLVEGTDLLAINPSAVITGNINGGGLATLDLRAENGTGILAAFGTTVLGFGTVLVDPGATWQLYGTAGSTGFTNNGTIIVAAGEALRVDTVGEDAGATGTVEVAGTVTFNNSVEKGQSVVFADRNASLVLDDAQGFVAKIEHFKPGDTIDIAGEPVTGTYAGGKLTLTNAKGATVATLKLAGHLTNSQFAFTADGRGGTLITLGKPAAASVAAFGASGPAELPGETGAPAWWVMHG